MQLLDCWCSECYGTGMNHVTETTLERFVDHLIRSFTPELAKHFAELPQPDVEFQARLEQLADKANEGTLSAGEASEYDTYIELMDFVALLPLKARVCASSSPNA